MGKEGFFEKLGKTLHLEDEDENTAEEVEEENSDTRLEEQGVSVAEENKEVAREEVNETASEQPVEEQGTEEGEFHPEKAEHFKPERTTQLGVEEETGVEQVNPENEVSAVEEEEVQKVSSGYSYEDPEITLAAARPRKKDETQTKQKPAQNEEDNDDDEEEGRLTIDVYETERDIVVKSTIAGVGHEDLDISITTDSISIRGKRQKKERVSEENYFYQECYWGAFSRSIILPTEIDPDKADATLDHGILTIRLPKLAKSQEKKLKVKPAK